VNHATAEGVRRFLDAFGRRDLVALQSAVTEDFLLIPVREALENITYSGRSGVADWLADIEERWVSVRLQIGEVREPVPDVVLVLGRVVGHQRGAGMFDVEVAWVARGRDGLIASIESFIEPDLAIAAATELG